MSEDMLVEQEVWFRVDGENVLFYRRNYEMDVFEKIASFGLNEFIADAYNACLPACGPERDKYELDWSSAVGKLNTDFPATVRFFSSIGYCVSTDSKFPTLDELDAIVNMVCQCAPASDVKKTLSQKQSDVQKFVLQQATIDRIGHSMTTRLVWSDESIAVFFKPFAVSQVVLMAVSSAISTGLVAVRICPSCGKAFIPRHRSDEIFCSDRCKKDHYKRVNPLMGKIDARQNLIRREINNTKDPRRMKLLNEAYDKWNKEIRIDFGKKQDAVRSTIAALVWEGKTYNINDLPEVRRFADEIKAEWLRCKHDAGID